MTVYVIVDRNNWCCEGAFTDKNKAIQYLIKTVRANHKSYNDVEDNKLIDCVEKQDCLLYYNLEELEVIE